MVQHNDTRGYVICADPMMNAAVDIKRAVNSFPILLLPLFPRFNLGSFRNEEISGSWYHGQVNVSLKDMVFEPSSPLRHACELLQCPSVIVIF